jgi:epoxyqueuosine reductase
LYAKINDLAAGIATTDKFKKFSRTNDEFLHVFWDSLAPIQKIDAFFASHRMKATPRTVTGLLKEILPFAMPVG